ncbi:hypothetical protein PC123_g12174 [Phytophthora cactorum]|nr:hypothetical protein PC123_g12174 [Phytophthora cactorum]
MCGKIADEYKVDKSGLLLYCPRTKKTDGERDLIAKLVVPEELQQDVLHHYHSSLEGGQQGIGRKGARRFKESRRVTYRRHTPFQYITMDHNPALPRSHKWKTELLLWIDLFTGYVLAKASASRTAQTIAENYEEDSAYRPQANGTAEWMVQTLTRALKRYVADVNQKHWDEYAERLTFALNTAHDRNRGYTPFYLAHNWDTRSPLEASLPLGSTRRRACQRVAT